MFWKKWPTRSNRNWIRYRFALVLCLLLLALQADATAADRLAEFQHQFDREPHATTKVKLLQKLGEAEFAAASSAQKSANYNDIGLLCEKYRDNVRSAFDLLRKQEPNAEKHAEGYRHLELQTRRGIREVEDLLIIVPGEVRPPLELVRDDLIHIDDELIHLLFPRRTKDPEKAPPPSGEKP